MRKFLSRSVLLCLVVFTALMAGCQKTESPTELLLPEGYTLEAGSDGSTQLCYEAQAVGGLVQTELPLSTLKKSKGTNSASFDAYLQRYAQEPMMLEYIAMYLTQSQPIVEITVKLSDSTKPQGEDNQHYYTHYLFEYQSACYDLWLDSELAEEEAGHQILKASGIW